MFVFLRAITYAALFVSAVLIYVPSRILAAAGVTRPPAMGVQQILGMIVGTIGTLIALWCVLAFGTIGRGTPMPLDPPRRLVVRGPYRFVRNPMYVGAGLALGGAALVYASWPLLGYAVGLGVAVHVFIVAYEEPSLRRRFGGDYERYCERASRWWPRWPAREPPTTPQ